MQALWSKAFLCAFIACVFTLGSCSSADDLVAAVAKSDAQSVLQQVGHGAGANEPSSKGQLPLVLAVFRGDLKSAEFLLNYRANASLTEMQSGMSAMTTAFSKMNAPMAELLLTYGGDPDAPDGSGRTARALTKPRSKLAEVLEKWDELGAMAFEDSPGTWTKHFHEAHSMPFYYNKETGRSQFMMPVSCAWRRATLDGHPVYMNQITHQARWSRPPAIAWKLLHAPGEEQAPYWYNYATDVTASDIPAELPDDMIDELKYDGGSYYHNTVTKEASWEDPSESGWRTVTDPDGRTFWYHPKTHDSTWERPTELAWKSIPTEDGNTYYHNERTSDVQWEKPVVIAWEKAQFNPHVNILS